MPRNPADRPATEPRTERVIEIVEEYNEDRAINGEEEAIANLARALARAEGPRHHPNDNCGDPNHDAALEAWYARAEGLLAREAAHWAAPRAEALLRRLVAVVDAASMHWTDPVPADSIWAIHDAKEYLASRPSDERVPESEEPR